ncbi:MAG: erythromycin esterase family protein [Cyclobacteriaceae bacterium]
MIKKYLGYRKFKESTCFVLFFCLLWLVAPSLSAQHFWNTSFEHEVYGQQPRKWSIEQEGESYDARVVNTASKDGQRCLEVSQKNASTYLLLSIPGNVVVDKKIGVNGYIKTSAEDTISIGWMLLNPETRDILPPKPNLFVNQTWEQVKLEHTYSEAYDASRLLVVLFAEGSAKFWVDDITIMLDGEVYGVDPPDFREPTKEEIALLDKYAKPIDPQALNTNDLRAIVEMVDQAKVVALGENSHGSSTLFKFKLRATQLLIKELGFSVFALESPTVEADKINAYVLGGQLSRAEILDNLTYPSWQTQDMLDIIDWIRLYNTTAKAKVTFAGFDMQSGQLALLRLGALVAQLDQEYGLLLTSINELYDREDKSREEWRGLSELVKELKVALQDLAERDENPMSEIEINRLIHYADILTQSIELNSGLNSKTRDEYMADNIEWISEYCNCKVIVSADNDHIRKKDAKAGYYLSQRLGDDYLALGMTYNEGTYSADGPKESYEVHPSYSGTYEYLLSKSRFDDFFIDIREVEGVPLLDELSAFRTIGSRPQDTSQFSEMYLRDNFDIIAFFKYSQHSKRLSNRD